MILDLEQREPFDLSTVVFVVSEAFEDLRTGKVGKGIPDSFHIAAKKKICHHIVDADASTFDSGISTSGPVRLDNVAVIGRYLHVADVITVTYQLLRIGSSSNTEKG
jgi:hypothetical protein